PIPEHLASARKSVTQRIDRGDKPELDRHEHHHAHFGPRSPRCPLPTSSRSWASVPDRDGARTRCRCCEPTAATPAIWLTGPRRLPTSPSRSCVNPWESRCSRCFHGGG